MKTVVILQRILPHYRVPFFKALRRELEARGFDLHLIYGQEHPGSVPVSRAIEAPWARQITNTYVHLNGLELVWQPCLAHLAARPHLVIVENANRLLVNHLLQLLRRAGSFKLAFWGHGRNLQASRPDSLNERFKAKWRLGADWWFAYTDLTEGILRAGGYPGRKMTVVENTIDTRELESHLGATGDDAVRKARDELGVEGNHVGLFCGGMTSEKRLDFLLRACVAVRKKVPDFHMIFLGNGSHEWQVKAAAEKHPWIHHRGEKYGAQKALYMKMSRVLLMPGRVGLVIVDGFAARLPLFTTDIPEHSPEIAYLKDGHNGVKTAFSEDAYAGAVAAFLMSEAQQEVLRKGCGESARRLTLDNMVHRFAKGVERCMASQDDIELQ